MFAWPALRRPLAAPSTARRRQYRLLVEEPALDHRDPVAARADVEDQVRRVLVHCPIGPCAALDLDVDESPQLPLDRRPLSKPNTQPVVGCDPLGAGVGVELPPALDLGAELGRAERARDRRCLRRRARGLAHDLPPWIRLLRSRYRSA